MVHFASVCTPCCILLYVVGSCYANFEIGQTSSLYVKTQLCWPTIVGSCWFAPFARSFTNARRMPGKGSGMGTLGLISFKRIIRFFFFEILHSRSLSTLLSQAHPCWEVKNTITSGVLRTNFYQEIRLKLGILKDKFDSRFHYFLLL